MKNKYSKTDGENKIVDGDMVEFGNNDGNNLEQRIDIIEHAKPETIAQLEDTIVIDSKKLCALYDISKGLLEYTLDNNEIYVADLKTAIQKFATVKKTYVESMSELESLQSDFKTMSESLVKHVGMIGSGSAKSIIEIPESIYKYLKRDIIANTERLNRALYGLETSDEESETQDERHAKIKDTVAKINDMTKELCSNRNIVQTYMIIDHIGNDFKLLHFLTGGMYNSSSTIESREESLANIPPEAIKIKYVKEIDRDPKSGMGNIVTRMYVVEPAPAVIKKGLFSFLR